MRQGHRNRLRERFLKAGRLSLADYELLELLLTYTIPRKDTKPIAKNLLKELGSFAKIFDQTTQRLQTIKGVGPHTAAFFTVIREFMVRYLEQEVESTERISSPDDVARFIRAQHGSGRFR